MKVSKRCQYALRALMDLGIAQTLGNPLIRIGDLAQKENIPLKFLEQIFLQLKDSGYIESRRGKQGGYLLAVPAAEITFGEIIRQIDGPIAPIPCVSRSAYEPCTCPDEAHCGLHAVMAEVHEAITEILDGITLADSIKSTLRKIRRNKVVIPLVKMLTRRSPRKSVRKVEKAEAVKKRKAMRVSHGKKRSSPSRKQKR